METSTLNPAEQVELVARKLFNSGHAHLPGMDDREAAEELINILSGTAWDDETVIAGVEAATGFNLEG